jgi:geranylgeranyl pyrophosphate synthase
MIIHLPAVKATGKFEISFTNSLTVCGVDLIIRATVQKKLKVVNKANVMETELADEGVRLVETQLREIINSDVQVLQEASEHIVTSGGKRIRPRIVILSYLAAGGKYLQEVIPLASAVEMVHTATLVHDDINDHSLTRRGKITVHARWGRTFALLTGDYLFTKVYELMAPFGAVFNEIMADACIRLVEGETLQAAAAKSGSIDRDTYKQIISRKTASLFESGARMGALLAGAEPPVENALAGYAFNLGLTFQIVDDILDIVGDPEAMGKPVGSDLAQGRGAILTQNGGGVKHTLAVKPGVPVSADPLQQMMAHLRESGAVELARLQAKETAQRARLALAAVPDSPARSELETVIGLVLERDR